MTAKIGKGKKPESVVMDYIFRVPTETYGNIVLGLLNHGQGLAFAVGRAKYRGLPKLRLGAYGTATVTLAENVTAAGMGDVLAEAGLERILREG